MAKNFQLKTQCPYCHRIEVHKDLNITSDIIVQGGTYTYEDVQCGMCGSKYDITFQFNSWSKKHSKSLRRVGMI